MKTTAALMATLLAAAAHAHEGHGLAGPHWHASDSLGFIVLAAVVAGAIWIARRK
ncbi:MAG: hypothetical protein JNJ42_09360 [Burkholderiaceae bacterium]|nr:hypothetical protein [Burkholderiaceae bacterium]